MTEKVILSKPVSIHGNTTNEIEVRPSTIGDEEDALQKAVALQRPNNPVTIEMCLFSSLTGIKYDDLRAMSGPDYAKIREAVNKANEIEQRQDPTT